MCGGFGEPKAWLKTGVHLAGKLKAEDTRTAAVLCTYCVPGPGLSTFEELS